MTRWSLRARLVAALLALLTLVCVVVAVVTAVALRSFLLGQLDGQLTAARDRFVAAPASAGGYQSGQPGQRRPPSQDEGIGFLGPGQAAATLGARISGGQIVAGVLDRSGSLQQIPGQAQQALGALPQDGQPHSQDLGSLGSYRLLAVTANDGDVLITGLPLSDLNATLQRLAVIELVVVGVAVLGAGITGAIVVRRTLRPLQRVAATAGRVAELPLDRGEVALAERVPPEDTDPGNEVGQVGAALNRMLDNVGYALEARQQSETKLRQFLADASHELRTPLAAIRGYAELTRRDREDVPPHVAHALVRMESQTARMSTLVEDMLLLARLDAGRPLDRAPVDLTRLVVDAVSDAHAVSPDHAWLLALPDEPVTVPGDALRLQQAVTNLLANARSHTPPGTTVTIGLTNGAAAAALTVTDDGPGIPPALLPHVFERFARGEASRSRAAGSTGLGLAIVAAVTAAHHGTVEVDSVPGRTSFTIRLPA